MATFAPEATAAGSPLERFVRQYVETIGGAWQEVEPQVYDLLLPPGELASEGGPGGEEILRLAFDPEAIQEHPGAQLASFGTPVIDRLLSAAIERGRFAQLYFNGLNLSPYDLFRRAARALSLPQELQLTWDRVRPLHVSQAIYSLEATFTSDQKEEDVLSLGIDLHSGRQVRHTEALLDFSRLAEQPSQFLIEARRESAAAGYRMAREQALRTLSSLANVRRRELEERLKRQLGRMSQYYRDLRGESAQQIERSRERDAGADVERLQRRCEALDREERLRVAELRQKSALRVRLKLLALLVVRQPKLFLKAAVRSNGHIIAPTQLELVWDPLTENLEALTCPRCQAPTYQLELDGRHRLACPNCAAEAGGRKRTNRT